MPKIQNAEAIVKMNFKLATLDAMGFDYFRSDYDKCEEVIDAAINQKVDGMSQFDIKFFATAICDGCSIGFDKAKEDYFVTE